MAKKKTMIEGFWNRFEECLLETNETKVDIAKKVGCNRKVFTNDFNGTTPRTQVILKFCAEYGVSLGYICGISKEKESNATDLAVVDGFWDRFNECIEESGSTKVAVAKRVGCERKTLYKISNDRLPSLLYIARFCTAYKVSPEYLVGTSNQKQIAA